MGEDPCLLAAIPPDLPSNLGVFATCSVSQQHQGGSSDRKGLEGQIENVCGEATGQGDDSSLPIQQTANFLQLEIGHPLGSWATY